MGGGVGAQLALSPCETYEPMEFPRSSVVAAEDVGPTLSVPLPEYLEDAEAVVAVVDVVAVDVFLTTVGCIADADDAFEGDRPSGASVSIRHKITVE